MDRISPQDIALFKNVTQQDDNTAKTWIFRYSNVDTAIERYFASQEPESSNGTTNQTNSNPNGPSTNSSTFLNARSSLPKKESSRPGIEPTTAPTTSEKNDARETISITDSSDDEDFDPSMPDELDQPDRDPYEQIKSTILGAIQSGMDRMLTANVNVPNIENDVAEFRAVTDATEAVARSYLARYGDVARALDEYFVRDTVEGQAVNNGINRATVAPIMFPPIMNFRTREKVKHPRKNKRTEHSGLALRLKGGYDAYVKKHLKADLLESNAKEWPKFLGSLLVECRINTQDTLSKMKIKDEVRFEPEEVEYTSTNITKKQKNSEGIATKVVVGKNWYIKGSSLLVRCIWKNQFVGYLNCEYEEAFVFLLSKKYIFVEGVIVDCPEIGKNGEFSVHGNNQLRGFSGFNKIKVQLDIFMTEEVITNPLNIVAIPGRRRGGVRSTRSAKTDEDEIEDSKEAQQMYQILRLAKESFVKLFKMLELKVTIPTVVQVRQRFDPFQRIKREKYGFKAKGRGRYFTTSFGVPAEVITDDFKEYYKSAKKEGNSGNSNGPNRAQTLNNRLTHSEDDEDDEDFDDDMMDEDEEDESLDSSDSDEPRLMRMNTQPAMFRRGFSNRFEDSKGQDENSNNKDKQNQDLFGSTNQISSYYKATEPPGTLKSTLHVYQKQALSWMMHREGLLEREELFETKLEEHRLLNDLFQEMTLLDGSKVYFNPFNGEISVEFPTLKACKGGILADEMGLGKTVMTIALIHAHNRKMLKAKKMQEDDDSEEEADDSEESEDDEDESDEEEDIDVKPKPRRGKARQAKKQAKKKPFNGTLDSFLFTKRIPAMNKKRQAVNELNSDDEPLEVDDVEKDEDFEITTSKKKLKVDTRKTKNVGKKAVNAAKKPTPSKGKAVESKGTKSKEKKPAKAKKGLAPKVIQGGTLIVLPLTVLNQWTTEIKNHSKKNTLSVLQYYGGGREKYNLEEYDVVLTTYGTLETENSKHKKETPSALFDCQWFRVILDEAHYIKGRQTKTTKAACSLQAEYRWCLTGTPLQNRLDDMFSLMQFLKVDTWGEYFWWNTYINKYTSHDEAANLIRGILKPLILRRTKKSTYLNGTNILELPGKEIKSHFVKLTHEERAIYNCFFQGSKQQFNDLVANGSIQYEYAHIFELLIRLRQVCDHPSLVFSKDDLKDKGSLETAVYKFLEKRMPIGQALPMSNKQDSLKKAKTMKKDGEKEGEDNEKIDEENSIMQSEFIQKTLERLKNKELEPCCICLEEITDPAIAKCGHIFCKTCLTLSISNTKKCPLCQNEISLKDVMSISLEDQDRCRDLLDANAANFKKSSKLAAVIDAVHDVAKRGEKVVIFSQFIGMLNLVERFFKEENIEYRRIDGACSMNQRTRNIDDFNKEKGVTAFLISLKAGAIGLNLTVATNVFLVDPWWNPAIEDQAIERVHRIGQKSAVNVVRFVCEKTIEERIQQLNAQKKDMINKILQFNPQEQKKQNLDNMIYVMRGFDDE